ncbi:MAG: hypothetical protein ABJO29_06690 [Yoonia sp.]|uniref:hypothetical protein n=1 Tax=Yoonia sp. TaxID=2212373 RepID=UPI0032679C12
MNKLIREMAEIAHDDARQITEDQICKWAGSQSIHDFLNSVAIEIAKRYHTGSLDYSTCDIIVSDLFHFAVHQPEIQLLFYEVFLAFDRGAYQMKTDLTDDPISEFTKPWIAEILLSQRID